MNCRCYDTAFEDGWQAGYDDAAAEYAVEPLSAATTQQLKEFREFGTGYLLQLQNVPDHIQIWLIELDNKIRKVSEEVLDAQY